MFVSPARGRVTSHWGPRERHPVTGVRGFHRGIDIAPPTPGQTGWPVYACYGGTVRGVVTGRPNGDKRPNPWTGTWNTGNGVLIDGPGGGSEWYGHLATINVAAGDRVKPGDVLGTMGASGNVTGIHLHLEMWNGRTSGGGSGAGNTRDPREDFRRHGVTPGSAPHLVKSGGDALNRPDKTTPTPLPPALPKGHLDMHPDELNRHLSRHAENVVAQVTKNADDVIRQRDAIQNTALHNMVRRELAAAVAGIDLDLDHAQIADRIGVLLEDDVREAVADAVAEQPDRDATAVAAAVVGKIANRLKED